MGQFFAKPSKDRLYLQTTNAPAEGSSSAENDLIVEVDAIVLRCAQQLDVVRNYQSPMEALKKAISSPGDMDSQREAIKSIAPNIAHIKQFFTLADDLGPVMQKVLCFLDSQLKLSDCEQMAQRFAKLAIFVLEFDQIKMMNSDIQNDFSFYKRAIAKLPTSADDYGTGIDRDNINTISVFLPKVAPMLAHIAKALTQSNALKALATVANVSCEMVKYKRVEFADVTDHLKLITSSLVIYDLCDEVGSVFAAGTQVKIRQCISVLVENDPEKALVNCVKFLCPSFKNNSTPARISSMLS